MSGTQLTNSNDVSRISSTNTSQFSDKYHGMIKVSSYKKIRNLMFVLFAYIYSVSPNYYPLHSFMSAYRVLQLLTPVLCAPFDILWKNSNSKIAPQLASFISIFVHILPVNVRDKGYIPILYLYIIIEFLFMVAVMFFAFYYKKKSQLPFVVPYVIVAFVGFFGYFLPPLYSEYVGEMIGHMISGTNEFSSYVAIPGFIISIIIYTLYMWLFVKVITVAATFRPNSLLSVTKTPQTTLLSCTVIVNFFSGIASKAPKTVCVVFMALTILTYFSAMFTNFMDGGYISTSHSVLVADASCSGAAIMLVNLVLVVLNKPSSEIVLVSIIAVFIVIFFVARAINNSAIYKYLATLDSIYDNEESFDAIKSPSSFMNILTTGMSLAHPVCTNWSLCRLAAQRWPNDIRIWYLFAKFVAIYPEETQQLLIISQNIMQNKLKGSYAKQTLEQIYTVVRLREANLSPHLKEKLNEVTKLTQTTKHKMRHVWDMIIQGNIAELENAIHSTYTAIEKCSAEYHHILSQYPNNRFVTRNYSRFMLDILADIKEFEKYDNDTKLLQRGINASEDQAHKLGLHAFPMLPVMLKDKMNGQLFAGTTGEEMSTIDTVIDTEGITVEQTQAITKQIDGISIPSFVLLKYVRPIVFIILCIVPIVAMLAYSYLLVDSESTPLTYISVLSSLRGSVFMLPTFSEEYVFESINCVTQQIEVDSNPYYLGSSNNVKGQLNHLNNEASQMITALKELRDFSLGNKYIDQVRATLFTNKYNYITFPDNTNSSAIKEKPTTLYGGIVDYVLMVTGLLEMEPITTATLGLQNIQNQLQNIELLSDKFSDSMDLLLLYMDDQRKIASDKINIIMIVLCLGIAIIVIFSNYFILKKVSRDKMEIYRCLTTLPKNVVSNIADRLKILKKTQTGCGGDSSFAASSDNDMNKQEENMLKIFATAGGDAHTRTRMQFTNSILAFVDFLFLIGGVIMIGLMTKKFNDELNRATPHVNYFLGAFSYAMGIVDNVYRIGSIMSGCRVPNIDIVTMQAFNDKLMDTSINYFNIVRYGSDKVKSFQQFSSMISELNGTSNCNDSEYSIRSIYACMKPELRYHFFESLMNSIVLPTYKYQTLFLLNDEKVTNLWHLLTIFLYNDFFAPLSTRIVDDVKNSVNSQLIPLIIISAVFAFIVIVIEIINLVANIEAEKKVKFTIRLLLHCPPNAILQNSRISGLLAGNFGEQSHEKTLRNSEYFQEILRNLPDSIVLYNEAHIVTEMNKSSLRLFDVKFHEEMNTKELFNASENMQLAKFFSAEAPQTAVTNPNNEDSILFKRADGTNFHLQVSVAKIKTEIIVTARDITQTVRYNTLIAEERAKSEVLLSSILPPKLVPRVRAGEKDISFAVQTASISFIDIVEFTPWCASLQADEVMTTLNKLFTLFDGIVSKYPTMTRIKCIGDCYMAAGGIFSELNQPDVHAKEVVEFGLDAIVAVEKLNQDIGQQLRIRVGINTGGPIVAGVLGVGKPTFEIIGPAINMAQQMEHHGVSMQVHISRSVYELIYGGEFEVKERGEIEIKNGSALTYLVSRK